MSTQINSDYIWLKWMKTTRSQALLTQTCLNYARYNKREWQKIMPIPTRPVDIRCFARLTLLKLLCWAIFLILESINRLEDPRPGNISNTMNINSNKSKKSQNHPANSKTPQCKSKATQKMITKTTIMKIPFGAVIPMQILVVIARCSSATTSDYWNKFTNAYMYM